MGSRLPLFPEQASTIAGQVDALYFFLIAITVFFSLLIAGLVICLRRQVPPPLRDRACA